MGLIMGWWSAIFGAPKAVEKVAEMGKTIVDGAVSGIDAIFYTDEEKAEARQRAADTILKYWETIGKENTEQSRARRDLAKMTFKAFFALIFLSVLTRGLAIAFPVQAQALIELSNFMIQCIKMFSFIISAITIIYFGPHQLSKVAEFKKKK